MLDKKIIADLESLTDWQDRYQTIIEAGEALPPFPAAYQNDQHKVKGCMSNVWLIAEEKDGHFVFNGTSDALIVKGLVALLLSIANHKTRAELQQIDFENIFSRIKLSEHLSQTRRNGFAALIQKIKTFAAG